jgi:hypothetical protein
MAAELGGDDRRKGSKDGGVGLGIKLDTQNPNLNYLDLTLKHLNLKYPDHYFR